MPEASTVTNVSPPANSQIAEVEKRILNAFGISRGQTIIIGASSNPAGLRAELKAWLLEQGIKPLKIERSQDSTLARAYESDKYLDTLRYDFKTKRQDDVGNPKYGWKLRSLNLDGLDIDEPSTIEPPNTLDDDDQDDFQAVPERELVGEVVKPPEVTQPAMPEQKLVSIQDLARAADQVISPRLSAMRAELERSIQDKISKTKLTLSDDAKQAIKDLAKSAAIEAITNHLPPRKLEIINTTTGTVVDLGMQHFKFEILLRACQARNHEGHRLNIWLTGPTGSGKSHAAKVISKALKLEFSFDGSLDNDYKVLGFVDAHGNIVSTAFLERFEHGGIYLADEIDGWLQPALVALNAAMSNGWCRDAKGRVINRHPDFCVIAAANTWGLGATNDYVARLKQDAAALDRFQPKIDWPYDFKLEMAIADSLGGHDWCEIVQKYRQKAKDQGLQIIISPRATYAGIGLLKQDFSTEEVIDMTIAAGLSDDQRKALGIGKDEKPQQNFTGSLGESLDEFNNHIYDNRMIDAIKVLRNHTGWGLLQSKNYVEDIIKGYNAKPGPVAWAGIRRQTVMS